MQEFDDDDTTIDTRGSHSVTQTPGGSRYSFAFVDMDTPLKSKTQTSRYSHHRFADSPASVVTGLFFPKTPRPTAAAAASQYIQEEDDNDSFSKEEETNGENQQQLEPSENSGSVEPPGVCGDESSRPFGSGEDEPLDVVVKTISLVKNNDCQESVATKNPCLSKVACAAEDNRGVWRARPTSVDSPPDYATSYSVGEEALLKYLKTKYSQEKRKELDDFTFLEQATLLKSLEYYMKTNDSLVSQQSRLQTHLETLSSKITHLETANKDLLSRGQQHSTIWISLTNDILRLTNQQAILQEERDSKSRHVETLVEQVADLQGKLNTVLQQGNEEVHVLHERIEALESEKRDLLVLVERLECGGGGGGERGELNGVVVGDYAELSGIESREEEMMISAVDDASSSFMGDDGDVVAGTRWIPESIISASNDRIVEELNISTENRCMEEDEAASSLLQEQEVDKEGRAPGSEFQTINDQIETEFLESQETKDGKDKDANSGDNDDVDLIDQENDESESTTPTTSTSCALQQLPLETSLNSCGHEKEDYEETPAVVAAVAEVGITEFEIPEVALTMDLFAADDLSCVDIQDREPDRPIVEEFMSGSRNESHDPSQGVILKEFLTLNRNCLEEVKEEERLTGGITK
ncbi:hypothetical protein BDR26DRAFT_858589 [Obelidium mucronatum]|nr:hypothetical protein BDR26DRAFT_858589 [Obelidium mucronatum]